MMPLSPGEAYDRDPEREWGRLETDAYHRLEFTLTMEALERHLPAEGLLLDAGGGPGRYARELCRRGYEVVLVDASAGNVALAREQLGREPPRVRSRLRAASVGDIRDLSAFADGAFDAVLSLGGPLSHLPEEGDRARAVRELVRVAAAGAPVALTGIGYLAILRVVMSAFPHELADEGHLEPLRGHQIRPSGMLWHLFRAAELRELAESCGLETLEMVGCEGLCTGLPDATNALAEDPARWVTWMAFVRETVSEPAVVDMAEHILYIGRKAT